MLSWYNYRMMRYRAEGQASYSFRLHLRAMPPDPVAHFLLERWFELSWTSMARLSAGTKIAMLDEALSGFDFTGDVAEADRLIARVSADLGIPETAQRVNTGEGWQADTGWTRVTRDTLDPADAALLARRTRLDSYLWHRWGKRDDTAHLDPSDVAPFLRSELLRPIHELRRRLARRG
jgi:hypothetical protein